MAIIFPVPSHGLKQELPKGICYSKIHFFSHIPTPWLVVSANEAMIWNLSSTIESISEFATEETPAQQ